MCVCVFKSIGKRLNGEHWIIIMFSCLTCIYLYFQCVCVCVCAAHIFIIFGFIAVRLTGRHSIDIHTAKKTAKQADWHRDCKSNSTLDINLLFENKTNLHTLPRKNCYCFTVVCPIVSIDITVLLIQQKSMLIVFTVSVVYCRATNFMYSNIFNDLCKTINVYFWTKTSC